MQAKTAKEVMTASPVTLSAQDDLTKAAQIMKDHNVGFVPVVEQNKPVGVITDRDLVIRGLALNLPGTTKIEQVMSKTCVTVKPESTLSQAADTMAKHQIRRVLVVENDALHGIVALGDLAVREASDEKAGQALSQISKH